MTSLSATQLLAERRQRVVPRGVATATGFFVARADNAEVWDVDGRRLIDFGSERGFHPALPYLLRALREICDRSGTLLIVDEIQTGFARPGRMFARRSPAACSRKASACCSH